jgi:hypothetical protein
MLLTADHMTYRKPSVVKLRFLAALKVGQCPSAYAVTAIVYVMQTKTIRGFL